MRWATSICLLASGLCFLVGCNGSSSIDTTSLPAPVNAIESTSLASSSQIAAADALGRIGQPAVPPLAAALADADPGVRLQACRALAFMGAKAANAVPALQHALGDSETTVRQAAAEALGQIGAAAEPAVPALMQMMREKVRSP